MNRLAKLAILLLIFLNLLPGGFVIDTVDVGHFFSSIHMFEYAFNHGFQFGVDIIDNVGPYGYLHYPYIYAGGAFGAKTLWFALICYVYAYYATALTERILSWPERSLFLFAVIFFPLQVVSPWYSFEVVPKLAILFSAIYFLTEPGIKKWHGNAHIIFNGLFYALITLEKSSNFYYLVLLIFVLSAYWLSTNQWRNSLNLVGSYLFGLAVFWIAAGQHQLSALLDYFVSMAFFINAYQETLGQEMGETNFRYGLFYCGAAFILILFRLWISIFVILPRKYFPLEIFRFVLLAALFFLVWKQGMLRGNSSYGTFLYTVPILFAYLCLYPIAANSEVSEKSFLKPLSFRTSRILRIALFALVLLVIWNNVVLYQHANNNKTGIFKEFNSRFSALVHYRPAQTLKVLNTKFEKLKFENALPPLLKQALQLGRVDEFGSTPEVLLLNDLDYRPRPVPINFIASNAALNEKNGHFYQNLASAPDFVFLEEFGLRLSDSSAYLSLLFNYQAIATFKNWLVLKKRAGDWRRFERQKLTERGADFDEWISLAELQKSFLWMEIEAKPSLLGKVKRFLYKPDLLRLEIALDDGTMHSLPVSMAQLRGGFLLNPVIQTKKKVLMIARDKNHVPWDLAKAFRISMDSPEKSRLFEKKFKIQFSEVRSFSLSDSSPVLLDSAEANSLIDLFAEDFPVAITKFPLNLLSPEAHDDIVVMGLGGLESNDKESWRWAIGSATRLGFYMNPALPDADRQLLFKFAFKNGVPITDQSVTIRLNGKVVRHFTTPEIDRQVQTDAVVALAAQKGNNLLEIVYQDWNHGKRHVGANDPRRLAIVFMRFSLQQ